ncbi:hypothetical protein [Pseudomonas parafulva]|uniref:Uncharacterized protein n=1 Tax=Pseudomonas parafulva TaxID=157782 RepID=A0AAJ0PDM7_9PSED|nr:hypothetical protein [Pseudomonas parafulva]KTT13632.1 hypothetical protein NS96R_20990 [Pseudomonas parafulva]
MQPLTKPVQYNTCDVGILSTERVQAFRAYLENHGCQTRDGSGGQFFHVMTAYGWATMSRARKGRVGTPQWMRSVVESFMASDSTAMAPEFWDKFGITAATIPRKGTAKPVELVPSPDAVHATSRIGSLNPQPQKVEYERYLNQTTGEISFAVKGSLDPEKFVPYSHEAAVAAGFIGADLAQGPERTVEIRYQGGQVLELNEARLVPYVGPTATLDSHTPTSQADTQYLQDLRDDFALHAPLWLKDGESMADHADRRWKYAEAMMKARPATMA